MCEVRTFSLELSRECKAVSEAGFFIYLVIYLVFLDQYLQHMEVPRLGVKSEL